MHPALSVIVFTVASGLGYGLLVLLGVLGAAGALPAITDFGLLAMIAALGLITLGLFASSFHLGHPERAWRALTQVRSSWLSREGVAAILTYLPALVFAYGWGVEGAPRAFAAAGYLSALGGLLTIFCTAMIYASLRPIAQWNTAWTPLLYLLLALSSGGLLLLALLSFYLRPPFVDSALLGLLLIAAWGAKLGYWASMKKRAGRFTSGQATGLTQDGSVRQLDPPHTETNYLLREMGYRIARKHAAKLRLIAVIFAMALPLLCLLLASLFAGTAASAFYALAAVIQIPGLIVERWLFFAEAKHTVTLYYGAEAA